MVEAKLSPDRDGTFTRDGHLPDRGRIFLSSGHDSSIFRQESATGHCGMMDANQTWCLQRGLPKN
jgi:hypothetical protein